MRVILIALIILIWWLGVWGLIETIIQPFIKNNYWAAIGVYGAMISSVLIIMYVHPPVLDSLV
jgi:hypothetical protein